MVLTHRDDVADHACFRAHFGCDRILHRAETTQSTRDIEWPLAGYDPLPLAEDLLAIPVPGHTEGYIVLRYNGRFLFSGDHLAWSDELGQLVAFPHMCWYSWTMLRQSMQALGQYSFEWVLPGHGRRYHADAAIMRRQIERCAAWMATVPV